MRRCALAVLSLALAACAGDLTAPPPPVTLRGAYLLTAVDGAALPVQAGTDATLGRLIATEGRVDFDTAGRYQFTWTFSTPDVGPQRSALMSTIGGYAGTADHITFADTSMDQSWAGTSYTGQLADSVLTVRVAGHEWRYVRSVLPPLARLAPVRTGVLLPMAAQ